MPYMNHEPLDQLIAEAGMSFRQFAAFAGIAEKTLVYARRGQRVQPRTLRMIAAAVARLEPIKVIKTHNLVSGSPINKNEKAGATAIAPAREENRNGLGTPVEA